MTLLPDEGVVVSAGADGRVLTWRLTPSGDDVEDSPEEEIVLTSPYGKDAPPPGMFSSALAGEAMATVPAARAVPATMAIVRRTMKLQSIGN